MPFEYTNEFHDLINTCATSSGICNFKTFMFGKPEEINFDHNINFGDYSSAWTGTTHDNTVAHDLCSLTYPKTDMVDMYKGIFNWTFDIYACRLISDSNVKALTIEQNFGGLDYKIWKMISAFNSCDNRVLNSTLYRDYGSFNDKLIVVKASLVWQLNMICPTTTMIDGVTEEVCIDDPIIDYSAF